MARQCNAVFKGGGAKGIAYAGALQACRDWEIEFTAAAGSSAGAITATLVACGYTPDETIEMMPDALRAIEKVPLSMARIGTRSSVLDSGELHRWLANAIAHKVKGEGNYDPKQPPECTFKELCDTSEISLYVVTLDLAENQPRVFGPDPTLTPDSPVAPAVVASSAIPVAFPASRMEVDDKVHRLVDGGTWSNYPAFVFLDDEFRGHHGLERTELETIGFILDSEHENPKRPEGSPRPRAGAALISDHGSSANKFRLAGAVMSSTLFRWSIGLAPILFVMLSLLWLRRELTSEDSLIDGVDTQLQDVIVLTAIAVLALTGMAALIVAFVVVRLGRTIFDTGVVGASAAMGVGPGVAYWVGMQGADEYSSDHIAVRIKVPPDLTTLKFDAPEPLRDAAVAAGRSATDEAFGRVWTRPRAAPVVGADAAALAEQPTGPDVERGAPTGPVGRMLRFVLTPVRWLFGLVNHRYLRLVALMYVLIGGTSAGFEAMIGFAAGHVVRTVFWVGVVGTAVLAAIWLIATMRADEADDDDLPYPWLTKLGYPAALHGLSVVAILLAMLAVIGWAGFEETSFFTTLRAGELRGDVVDVAECPLPDECRVVEIGVSEPEVEDSAFDAYLELLFFSEDREFQQFEEFQQFGAVGSRSEEFELVDLRGNEVDLVGIEFDDSGESGDVLFVYLQTETPLAIGDEAELRVNVDERLVFLEQDLATDSSARISLQSQLVAFLALFMFAFRARRAARWLDQAGRQPARTAAPGSTVE